MNTVRAAAVTKSGNPLSAYANAELTLRVMPPATEIAIYEFPNRDNEVAA